MLNKKQELFCLEYMKCNHASEAYVAAGFNSTTKKSQKAAAHRLLRNPKIQERIKELMREMNKDKIADIQECQEHLTEMIRNKEAKAIARIRAIELLLKAQGAFETNINVTTAIPVVIAGGDSLED